MEVDKIEKTFNSFEGVLAYTIHDTGRHEPMSSDSLTLRVFYDPQGVSMSLVKTNKAAGDNNGELVGLFETVVERSSPPIKVGRTGFIVPTETEAIFLKMPSEQDAANLHMQLTKALRGNDSSLFAVRTEDSSALQYFQFYGYLSQQQNMMQDYVRTATYQRAILTNLPDFMDKVVLDVGAGSGILSFFAVQAGAKRVYAVEASSMAIHAETLSASNALSSKLVVVPGKIEEIELPEKVDTIISEPMGYMLYNERMLETYLHAKKWLKPGGKMFPTKGDLHVTPFTDEALYLEQCTKANFWQATCFHGVDLTSLHSHAMKEYFRQPVVDTFDIRICLAKSIKHTVDFTTAAEFDLHRLNIPLEFDILESGTVHGLAFWFDVLFDGTSYPVWLSTAPTEPLTHWYQVRCLIETPFFVRQGQKLKGKVELMSNKRQSYDVYLELETDEGKVTNTLDLKNPYFRYTGQPPQPPPGHHNTTTAPSDKIWTTIDTNGVVNGVQMNGLVDGMNAQMIEMPPTVMGVLQGTMPQHHPLQANSTVTHYTVPLLGDFVTSGQPPSVLLSSPNVIPHTIGF